MDLSKMSKRQRGIDRLIIAGYLDRVERTYGLYTESSRTAFELAAVGDIPRGTDERIIMRAMKPVRRPPNLVIWDGFDSHGTRAISDENT